MTLQNPMGSLHFQTGSRVESLMSRRITNVSNINISITYFNSLSPTEAYKLS